MVIVAWFETSPVASLTVYGIGVGSPWKVASGVNVTLPSASTLHVPCPATDNEVWMPAVAGSKSTVLTSRSLFGSLSLFVTFKVTAPGG